MKPSSAYRGAVLVESALVLIFLMGLMAAGFQIGVCAYYQLAVDQAAQAQARMYALSGGTNASAANKTLTDNLPNLVQSRVTFQAPTDNPTPVPMNDEGINYNFNSPGNRTGGFSFISPTAHVSTVQTRVGFLTFAGFPIQLSAYSVEAGAKELCPHFCLLQGGLQNAKVQADTVNYFTQGDNTTPFYMGFHFMVTCATNNNWQYTEWVELLPTAGSSSWSVCYGASATKQSTALTWRALGSAEHLDQSNNAYTGGGGSSMGLDSSYYALAMPPVTAGPTGPAGSNYYVDGTPNRSLYPPTSPPAPNQAGPFFEVWCHRNYYLWLDYYAVSQLGTAKGPSRAASANYNSQNFLSRAWGFFGTEGGAAAGAPRPAQMIYSTWVSGTNPDSAPATYSSSGSAVYPTSGWDATNISGGGGGINFSSELAPWWGCGVPQ